MENDSLEGKSAIDLFPDLAPKIPTENESTPIIHPPQPPDTGWLHSEVQEAYWQIQADSLTALVGIGSDHNRVFIENSLKKMGYIIDLAFSSAHAIDKIQSFQYNLIIRSEEAIFKNTHKSMCELVPAKRRLVYYVIVGPHFNTLHNLEALSLSANLVINDKDLPYLTGILTKGLHDYELLFGPFLDALVASNSSL